MFDTRKKVIICATEVKSDFVFVFFFFCWRILLQFVVQFELWEIGSNGVAVCCKVSLFCQGFLSGESTYALRSGRKCLGVKTEDWEKKKDCGSRGNFGLKRTSGIGKDRKSVGGLWRRREANVRFSFFS